MKQEKQQYSSPRLTVVEFATERGFAESPETLSINTGSYAVFEVGENRQEVSGSIW